MECFQSEGNIWSDFVLVVALSRGLWCHTPIRKPAAFSCRNSLLKAGFLRAENAETDPRTWQLPPTVHSDTLARRLEAWLQRALDGSNSFDSEQVTLVFYKGFSWCSTVRDWTIRVIPTQDHVFWKSKRGRTEFWWKIKGGTRAKSYFCPVSIWVVCYIRGFVL